MEMEGLDDDPGDLILDSEVELEMALPTDDSQTAQSTALPVLTVEEEGTYDQGHAELISAFEIPEVEVEVTPNIEDSQFTQSTTLPFLTVEEEGTLPNHVHAKLVSAFEDQRRTYESKLSMFESELRDQSEKSNSLCLQVINEQETTEEFVAKYRKALDRINQLEDTVQRLQNGYADMKLKFDQLKGEKDDLVSILNRRNQEITKLSSDVTNYGEQLQAATLAKIDAQFKVDQLTSKEMELDYKEKLIEKERHSISDQVQLLNEELDRKNREIIEIRRESSLRFLALQTEVYNKTEQLRIAVLNLENVKDSNEKQEQHISRLIEKLKDTQDMETKIEENHRQELKSQKRIADLYKDSSEESSKKVDELEVAVSNLQDLLTLATDRYGQLEVKFNQMNKYSQEQLALRSQRIVGLTEELQQTSEQLSNIRRQGLTDEMMMSISPAAAAASTMLRSTQSLNVNTMQSLQQSLRQAEEDNERLRNYINENMRDAQNSGPEQEDYERAVLAVTNLTTQLDAAMESEALAKDEYAQARKSLGVLERENVRLKTHLRDSALQIRTLLRQIEANRGSYVFSSPNANTNDSDFPDVALTNASSVITAKLVTFKNIDELQSQNQQLLAIVRELTEEREREKDNVGQQNESGSEISLEAAQKELEELRELRARHEKMIQSLTEQRDSYASLVEKKSPQKSPSKTSSASIQINLEWEQKLSESASALKLLQEEYEKYRRDKQVTEKIAADQIEKLREDLSRMRNDNAKLAYQTEYNNERAKIYTTNLDSYKKNIAILEEKNKAAALTIMKHEQTIVTLRAEASTSIQNISRIEANLTNTLMERNSLRDAKSSLQTDLECLRREFDSQKILQTSLADIKNNLEMNNSAGKKRLENQVECLEQEIAILRRKMDSESSTFKSTVLSWDTINRELQGKLDEEVERSLKLRKDMTQCQDTIREQGVEIEALMTKIRVLTGGSSQNPEDLLSKADEQGEAILSVGQTEHDYKTNELNLKLLSAQNEIASLKQHIELSRGSVDEYKSLCKTLEEQLRNATEESRSAKKEFEETVAQLEGTITEIQAKLSAVENENSAMKSEKEQSVVQDEDKHLNGENELSRMRRELIVANSKVQAASEECARVKTEFQNQVDMTREFQTVYGREVIQLSALRESHAALTSELVTLRSEQSNNEAARALAEERLKDIEESWEEEVSVLQVEISQLKQNIQELDSLNNSLQDQLVAFTNQLAPLKATDQSSASALDQSLNLSGSFDSTLTESVNEDPQTQKTVGQWIQLVRYMRQQRESAQIKAELAESNVASLQTQLKLAEKQREELQTKLDQSQDISQCNALSSTKQSEMLRKIETLSAITDSNRMLREQQETTQAEIQKLRSTIDNLESEMSPLRLSRAELESKCESLTMENNDLKQDLSKWRTRAAGLLDKTSKVNPEEWKALETQKDTLTRQCIYFQDLAMKLQTQKSTQAQQQQTLKLQVEQLKRENTALLDAQKTLTNAGKGANEEINRMKNENETLKSKDSEITELRGKLKKAQADLEEQKSVVKQVKMIARKYKKSFEDTQQEIETLKAQKSSLEAQASTSSSAAASAAVNSESNRQQATEVAADQQTRIQSYQTRIEELSQQTQGLKKDIENFSQREGRAKTAIKLLRDRNVAAAQKQAETENELTALKDKIKNLESASELNDSRLGALKSQYEGRLGRLEQENRELKASQLVNQEQAQASARAHSQVHQENERLRTESESQQQRILALERQLAIMAHAAPTSAPTTSASSSGEIKLTEPATANIKPMTGASSSKQTSTQVVQPGTARPQPTASIRPMSMTRKVLVMPNASGVTPFSGPRLIPIGSIPRSSSSLGQQPGVQTVAVAPVSQGQVSTSTPDQSSGASESGHNLPVGPGVSSAAASSSGNIRQGLVHPTPTVSVAPIASAAHTSAGGSGTAGGIGVAAPTDRESQQPSGSGSQQEGPSTSSHIGDSETEMSDSSEQVSSSDPSSHGPTLTVAPLRSQTEQEPPSGSSQQSGTQMRREEPSPSTSTSASRPAQSSKRTRDDDTEDSQTDEEPGTKRLCVSQSMGVEREAEAMSNQEGGWDEDYIEEVEVEDDEEEMDESEDEDEDEEDSQPPAPAPSARPHFEDDDSDVVYVSSDEDDESPPPPRNPPPQAQQRAQQQQQQMMNAVEAEDSDIEDYVEDEDEEEDVEDEEDEPSDEDSDNDPDEIDEDDDDDDDGMAGGLDESLRDDLDDVEDEGREAESLQDQEDDPEADAQEQQQQLQFPPGTSTSKVEQPNDNSNSSESPLTDTTMATLGLFWSEFMKPGW